MFCDIIPNLNKNVAVASCPGKGNIVYRPQECCYGWMNGVLDHFLCTVEAELGRNVMSVPDIEYITQCPHTRCDHFGSYDD